MYRRTGQTGTVVAMPRNARGDGAVSNRQTAGLDQYIEYLWDHNGSDLLLTAGAAPLARIDGRLQPVEGTEPLTPEEVEKLTFGALPKEAHERFTAGKEIDFSFGWGGKARFRANAFHQRRSVALAVRMIPFEIPSFEDLGLPKI